MPNDKREGLSPGERDLARYRLALNTTAPETRAFLESVLRLDDALERVARERDEWKADAYSRQSNVAFWAKRTSEEAEKYRALREKVERAADVLENEPGLAAVGMAYRILTTPESDGFAVHPQERELALRFSAVTGKRTSPTLESGAPEYPARQENEAGKAAQKPSPAPTCSATHTPESSGTPPPVFKCSEPKGHSGPHKSGSGTIVEWEPSPTPRCSVCEGALCLDQIDPADGDAICETHPEASQYQRHHTDGTPASTFENPNACRRVKCPACAKAERGEADWHYCNGTGWIEDRRKKQRRAAHGFSRDPLFHTVYRRASGEPEGGMGGLNQHYGERKGPDRRDRRVKDERRSSWDRRIGASGFENRDGCDRCNPSPPDHPDARER